MTRPRPVLLLATLAVLVLAHVGVASAATVSGTVLRDEKSGLPWAGCDGVTANIALRYNGVKTTTTCDKATGAFTMAPALGATQRVTVIWIDGAAPSQGALYTRNNGTANITGLTLTQNRVRVRSETATNFAATMFNTFDGSNDADIPINDDGTMLTTASGIEVHVDAGKTLDATGGSQPDIGSLHLGAGATYVPEQYRNLTLEGDGELTDCTQGPGLTMPLCLDTGATDTPNLLVVDFAPAQGDIQIPPQSYRYVSVSGPWTAYLGTGAGQTFTLPTLDIGTWWNGAGHVELSRWSPTIVADVIRLAYDDSTLRSSQPGSITVHDKFSGTGDVDIPEYAVTVDSTSPNFYLGATEESTRWRFGSLALRNSYFRPDLFQNGTGLTAKYDSGAGQDTPNDVYSWYNYDGQETIAGRSAAGAGSWVIRTQDANGTTAWTRTWDPTPAGDDVANAIADGISDWTTDLFVGGRIAQNGGDWAVRHVNSTTGEFMGVAGGTGSNPTTPYGNTDLDGNGTKDTYVYGHATGFDEVTSMMGIRNDQLVVAGTAWNGTSQQVRIVQLDSTGTEVSPALTYDTAGADYAPHRICQTQNGTNGIVVGGDSTNGGDMFVRNFDISPGSIDWVGVGAETTDYGTVDVDGNGHPDTLRWGVGGSAEKGGGCESETGYVPYVFGNRVTGANTDGFVMRIWDAGTPDTSFGVGGAAWFDSGTNGDLLSGIHGEEPSDSRGGVVASGRYGTNGGDGALMRFDADGQLDYSWGTNGVVAFDTGAGNDDGFFASSQPDSGYSDFVVAERDGSTGAGDFRIAGYSADGELLNGAAGKVMVQVASGLFTDAESEFSIANGLTIGNAADAADIVLDTETFDPVFQVDGDVSVSSRGWLRLSSATATTLRGDLVNTAGGKVHAGSGTVRIRPAGTTSLIAVGTAAGAPAFANSFAGLDIDLGSTGSGTPRAVQFPAASTTRVRSSLAVNGGSCAPRVRLSGSGGVAALDATGATRTGNFADVTNVTMAPAWTIANGTLAGTTTGWTVTTPCGAPLPLAPDDLYVHDTNAQAGTFHNLHVASTTPHFSAMNRTGTTVDQQRMQVWSDVIDGSTHNLLRLDGTAADTGAAGGTLTLDGGANAPTFTTGSTGRFGDALSFDGNDRARTTTGGFDSLTSVTIDGWVKKNGAPTGIANFATIEDGTHRRMFIDLHSDGTIDAGYEDFTAYTNGVNWTPTNLWDGSWHHVAATFTPVGSGVSVKSYLDGAITATGVFPNTYATTAGSQLYLGNSYYLGGGNLKATIDDVRVTSRVLTTDELAGYLHTGRKHGDLIWDSGAVASCSACPTTANSRTSDVTYAGPAGILLDGARYWVVTQQRTSAAGVPASTWSAWSEPDWFESRSGASISVTAGGAVSLGAVLPGSDAVATSTIDVSTTGGDGYTLFARGESDTWTMTSGTYGIPRWTGAPTPTSWAAGVPGAGYFGVTVLSATGGKDSARWGTGSLPGDVGNLKYGGLKKTTDLALHSRLTYSAGTDTIQLGWRANPPMATPPGAYNGTVTVVALANP